MLQNASTVIVLSKRLQEYVGTIAPTARTVTIHNFVDDAQIEAEAKRTSVERSSTTLLYFGGDRTSLGNPRTHPGFA
jgi:hypothetical protein